MPKRCSWCGSDPLYVSYHDTEWGIAVHDDRKLFEMLILEGAQAGLSWITVLRKRENYRQALHGFDWDYLAGLSDAAIEALMQNPGIIRNRLKIQSLVKNAKVAIALRREFGSLDHYFWGFVNHSPRVNFPSGIGDIPVRSEVSDAMSKDLKKRGMNFVGSTIMYAFMQAVGMVDDHIVGCPAKKSGNQST